MPAPPPALSFFGETLAAEANARLRAAVAAAQDGDPLKGVALSSRWQEIPHGALAWLECHFHEERGTGESFQLPVLALVNVLHINGYVAAGREDAVDLDTTAGQLMRRLLDLLLEDSTFLALFAKVESVNSQKNDAKVGPEHSELDAIAFHIELELRGGQTFYTPRLPDAAVPFQIVDVQTTTGDIVVEAQFPQEQ